MQPGMKMVFFIADEVAAAGFFVATAFPTKAPVPLADAAVVDLVVTFPTLTLSLSAPAEDNLGFLVSVIASWSTTVTSGDRARFMLVWIGLTILRAGGSVLYGRMSCVEDENIKSRRDLNVK